MITKRPKTEPRLKPISHFPDSTVDFRRGTARETPPALNLYVDITLFDLLNFSDFSTDSEVSIASHNYMGYCLDHELLL